MHPNDLAAHWRVLAEEAFTGMTEWRLQHPKATLREIETAVDERLARVRARMLQDAALTSAAATVGTLSAAERPVCPDCGQRLEVRGQEARQLTTTYDQPLTLTRTYTVCSACDAGHFPPG